MCGIVGIISTAPLYSGRFESALASLAHRGPDHSSHLNEGNLSLGHARLSVIDLDARAHQPMSDPTGRWTVVYNGEIFNYKTLRAECQAVGQTFTTESDTEVLLALYARLGKNCLAKLNGFFAFAIYDRKQQSLFIARDRFGVKPLVYFQDEKTFAFASEMRALMALDLPRVLDKVSLFTLFRLNYIPAPVTILSGHHKLEAGHCIEVKWDENRVHTAIEKWHEIPYSAVEDQDLYARDYRQSKATLSKLLRSAVRDRLVADVPVGSFLSGGIDSAIITALAKEQKADITAFSIGFPTMPYYDETALARKTAKHLGVQHHVFEVTERDLLQSAEAMLEHMDEPFGDSSILNLNTLSQRARQHVTVALSGDGGDEVFGGYRKHGAEFMLRYPRPREHAMGKLSPLWNALPASRSGFIADTVRKLQKFSSGYGLDPKSRYWLWAGTMNEEQVNYLMKEQMLPREQRLSDNAHTYKKRKDQLLRAITKGGTLNEVLLTDMRLVLPNDMLFKIDHASMAHNLEVRSPLLDYRVVEFAFKLPVMFKVNHRAKKKILCDTFAPLLPHEVMSAPKRGFEVPLLEWFRGSMKARFEDAANDRDFIEAQNLFNPTAIAELRQRLYSKNPADAPATAWTFLVFQTWFKRYMA